MKKIDGAFYKTNTWQRCRASYIKYRKGLCERCLSLGLMNEGVIVHHKKELTPENFTDPKIAYGYDNLMLLCRSCHEKTHKSPKAYDFDADGNIFER